MNETHLERMSRQSREQHIAAQASAPLVTQEARQHGAYEEGWTEVDGGRTRVMINRGGTTIERWLNAPCDDVLGDSERAAIRYCLKLWHAASPKGPRIVRVDADGAGQAQDDALVELNGFKRRFPSKHWDIYENICRHGHTAQHRQSRVMVGFVAGMIAMWCNL